MEVGRGLVARHVITICSLQFVGTGRAAVWVVFHWALSVELCDSDRTGHVLGGCVCSAADFPFAVYAVTAP